MDKLQLTELDQSKWIHNLITFLAPVAIVYIVAIVGIINAHNGAFSLTDLKPTSFTEGAIVLYLLNSGLDYLKKLTNN